MSWSISLEKTVSDFQVRLPDSHSMRNSHCPFLNLPFRIILKILDSSVSEWFKTCSLSPMNLIELGVYVILLFLVWFWTILFIFGRLIFCFVGQILSSCFWIMITSQVNCIDDWLQRFHIRTLNEFVCEVRAFFWNDERSSRNIPQFPWFSFRYFVCFRQYLNKSGILVCSSYRCFFRFWKCWSFSCAIFSLILRFSRICLMYCLSWGTTAVSNWRCPQTWGKMVHIQCMAYMEICELPLKHLGEFSASFLNFVYNKSSNIVLFCRSYAELSANGNWMFCVWLSGKFHRAETRLERKFCPLFYTNILGAL